MALTAIEQVRLLVQDNNVGFYVISDAEIEFLLERNNNSIDRTVIEAAKIILMQLSQRTDSTVDIFSLKGSKAASEYRMTLELMLKDPSLNPLINNVRGYVGGVSISDMEANDGNLDNNLVPTASIRPDPFKSYFG